MANTDRARKLLVRTSLVTSTTITTLIGAQNLAMLDVSQFKRAETPVTESTVALSPGETVTSAVMIQATPTTTILQAAPSIIILRQSGEQSNVLPASSSVNNTTTFQPPIPSQITVPNPVIIQQPVPQRSQSSR